MKTMKTVSRKENMHPSKSHIPRPQSTGKKMKAKPAPDFNKLHKKWEEQLQNGKNYKKKPSTLVQPFDVTKPGTKFTVQTKTTVLNDIEDDDMDFIGDQNALDTILQNRGLSERKVTGRTTIEAMSMSTGKIKNRSCTNGKRRILGELPCDPDQLTKEPITAKKSLAFDKGEKPVTDEEFETDSEALDSILNNTGIKSTPTTTENRQTFAGSVCRPSLLHHPLPARLSCMSAINKKKESKFDTESLLKSVRDRQQVKSTDYRHPAITKSPHRQGGGAPIVMDSPFGQKVMIHNRHSIYGDYHINPMSSPALVPQRPSMYGDHQFASPALKNPPQKQWTKEANVSNVHKHVKWADILNSYSSSNPCAVPKIKEKKTLFSTIDEIDNDIDEGKENIEPPQPQNEIDKINNSYDVTTVASDGQRRNESSSVATALQNSAASSMTHSKLLEPREKHLNKTITDPKCKVQSVGALRESTPTRSFTAKRIPITTSNNDLDNRNCVSNPPCEKNRTVCNDIETSLHHSGIQILPKQGVTNNGTAFNLLHSHSTYNHGRSQVSREISDGIQQSRDDNLNFQNQGVVSLGNNNTAMAMHTEEKEENEDSDVVSTDPNSQNAKNRSCRTGSDSESVDKFVGRVKKNRKRQSIVELNESIVESQVHLNKLQVETEKLQDVKDIQEMDGSQTNINILQQLQLISKQQEQLQILQKQLQEQLSQQTSVSMAATISKSHDTASVSSANESNNNVQQQSESHVTNIQNQGHMTGCDNLNVNTCSENIINNNLTPRIAEDNQNISQPMSIFVSSTAALSQTLSHSRTWSPCNELTLTPSKRQPRVAIETEIDITPYVQKTFPQTEGQMPQVSREVSQFEQIRSPTPTKQKASSSIASLYSSTPPMWTPLALMEASHDVTPKLCDNDIKTCTSQVAAIDLSVKRPIDDENSNFQNVSDLSTRTRDESVSPVSLQNQQVFTPISAFSRVRSPSGYEDNDNIGPLSLRANVLLSPVDLSSKKKRLSLRRTVISVPSDKFRYQEALLDEECALYSCRLQTVVTPGCNGRSFINPVARMLLEGDEMHFIPIREDSPVRHYVREGSAFKCYSP